MNMIKNSEKTMHLNQSDELSSEAELVTPTISNEPPSVEEQIIACREAVAAAWRDTMLCYGRYHDPDA